MSKSLFNFYLDDADKVRAIDKLNRLNGEKSKGQLSSLIRVMIKQFIATPDDKVNQLLLDAVSAEYEFSAKLNKRSRL